MNQRGFSIIEIGVGVAIFTIIGVSVYTVYNNQSTREENDAQPTPTIIVPIDIPTISPTPLPTTQAITTPTPTPDPYNGWQTYTNSEFNYSIRFPSDWAKGEYHKQYDNEPASINFASNSKNLQQLTNGVLLSLWVSENDAMYRAGFEGWMEYYTAIDTALNQGKNTIILGDFGSRELGIERVSVNGTDGVRFYNIGVRENSESLYYSRTLLPKKEGDLIVLDLQSKTSTDRENFAGIYNQIVQSLRILN